jgi:hypothetical protein
MSINLVTLKNSNWSWTVAFSSTKLTSKCDQNLTSINFVTLKTGAREELSLQQS